MPYPLYPAKSPRWSVSVAEAIAYAQDLLASRLPGMILCGTIRGLDDTRDVLFQWDGHRYRLTCWREENGAIYGEW